MFNKTAWKPPYEHPSQAALLESGLSLNRWQAPRLWNPTPEVALQVSQLLLHLSANFRCSSKLQDSFQFSAAIHNFLPKK